MKKGFTLIELLIVVAVLGVLGSIVVISFNGSQASARDARRASDVRQYAVALESYSNSHSGNYPSGDLTISSSAVLCPTINVGNCALDPKNTSPYQYRYNSNGATYALWARLERNAGATAQYFVLCSDGKVGKTTNYPAGGCGSVTIIP